MASKAGFTVLDYGGEYSGVYLRGPVVSAANFDATEALRAALETALDGIVIGTVATRKLQTLDVTISTTKPGNVYAQRETKWLVRYSDNVTGSVHTAEVPCADLSLLVSGGEVMDIAAGAGLAFVTAFEDWVLSPAGNAVTVSEIVHVGRNI